MRKPFDILEYKQPVWEQKLDDLSGFRYEKALIEGICLDEEMDELFLLPFTKVFLISGPDGYGKHTLAKTFSNALCKIGYEFFRFDGKSIMQEENPIELLRALLEDIIRATIPDRDTGHYCKYYILFDRFDVLCEDKEICNLLADFFEELDYDNTEYVCNCVFSCISENMTDIPISIRKYMNILELELPDEEDRKEFFENEFYVKICASGKIEEQLPLKDDYPAASLAKMTQDFTYGELRKVVFQGKLLYKRKVGTLFWDITEPYPENGEYLTLDEMREVISRVRRGKRKMVQKNNNVQSYGMQMPPIIINGATGTVGNQTVTGMGTYYGPVSDETGKNQKDFVDLQLFDSIDEEQEYEQYSNGL